MRLIILQLLVVKWTWNWPHMRLWCKMQITRTQREKESNSVVKRVTIHFRL